MHDAFSQNAAAQGAFSHSAGTAPIITVFIPGTPLQTPPYPPPLRKHAESQENDGQMGSRA